MSKNISRRGFLTGALTAVPNNAEAAKKDKKANRLRTRPERDWTV